MSVRRSLTRVRRGNDESRENWNCNGNGNHLKGGFENCEGRRTADCN